MRVEYRDTLILPTKKGKQKSKEKAESCKKPSEEMEFSLIPIKKKKKKNIILLQLHEIYN